MSCMNGIGPPILKQAELIELAGETGQHQRLSRLLHIVNASFILAPYACPKAQI